MRSRQILQVVLQIGLGMMIGQVGQAEVTSWTTVQLPRGRDSAAEIATGKITRMLINLRPQDRRHGWSILFLDDASYRRLHQFVMKQGFGEVGAEYQIRKFALHLEERIRYRLLGQHIFGGPRVALEVSDPSGTELEIIFHIENQAEPLKIVVEGKEMITSRSQEQRLAAASAVVGREVLRRIFMPQLLPDQTLSILPGVKPIVSLAQYYRQLANNPRAQLEDRSEATLLHHLSILLAPSVAQELAQVVPVDINENRANMNLAVQLAETAILRWGVWAHWHVPLATAQQHLIEVKTKLNEEELHQLHRRVDEYLWMARDQVDLILRTHY
jgi:hypothetical protein